MYIGLPNLGLQYRQVSGSLPAPTVYSTVGTQSVSKPSGAVQVVIECYGSGAGGDSTNDFGGGGGAYSKTTITDLSTTTALYLSVAAKGNADGAAPSDCFVKQNTSGGTTLCLAKGGGSDGTQWHGGAAPSGTGDTKFSGGNGSTGNGLFEAGGGAAGPNGNGGSASADGSTPGTSNGGLAGNGGDSTTNGRDYGGGGGTRAGFFSSDGAQSAIKLTWT